MGQIEDLETVIDFLRTVQPHENRDQMIELARVMQAEAVAVDSAVERIEAAISSIERRLVERGDQIAELRSLINDRLLKAA